MIYLYGASGYAKVIIEILEQAEFIVCGLVDANPAIKTLLDYPVYNTLEEPTQNAESEIIISIGNNTIRKKISEEINRKFAKAIHRSANISSRCLIGDGTVVMAGVSVNSGVIIGMHVILNTNCSVDHDCILDNYVHISPNAALAGNVMIGEGTHVGVGASIIQGIKIGKWATIGAGTVIIKEVPDYAVVVGNPGKIIKYNTAGI